MCTGAGWPSFSGWRRLCVAIATRPRTLCRKRSCVPSATWTASEATAAWRRGCGRIVLNTARNHRRDSLSTPRWPAVAAVEGNGHGATDVARVAAAVSALPERQRLVLFLRYYADLDYEAITQTLNISTGTVGAALTAARTRLEQLLSEAEGVR
jgi:DNA-directed RNA polymerase specialized sigma24 family protein